MKLWLRRWTLRRLRWLVDLADDRLHAAETRLRNDLCGRKPVGEVAAPIPAKPAAARTCLTSEAGRPQGDTFLQWEARRSGVAVISKKEARLRRGMTALSFDLKFSER